METVDSIKVRVGIGAVIIAGLAVVFVMTSVGLAVTDLASATPAISPRVLPTRP